MEIKNTSEIVNWSNDCEIEEITPRSNKKGISTDSLMEYFESWTSLTKKDLEDYLKENE